MSDNSHHIFSSLSQDDQSMYPLFVKLNNENVVVVGAGKVATRKIATLLYYGAQVSVVAPEAAEDVLQWANSGAIDYRERCFKESDLDNALLVIAATSDTDVNTSIYKAAKLRSMLVNVVDVPDLCNCFIPSIMQRGKLQIAVSTSGASPTLAKQIRHKLEQEYPSWWSDYIELMAEVRLLVKERLPESIDLRSRIFESLTDPAIREEFEQGRTLSAEEVYDSYVVPYIEGDN